jgi:hypothetical protein
MQGHSFRIHIIFYSTSVIFDSLNKKHHNEKIVITRRRWGGAITTTNGEKGPADHDLPTIGTTWK